ncbi:heavy-metal-associated domain-containing protein [Galbibacter sp. EGI 63066]|uniref:heavy-metal-associated domain-containing protein n=1 Tax=Galbibacter sp. EGI 63066 TaxID=2993559 RepID=UPI00224931C8|nr:heavy-metal-associated domain-containing protein [Galbibacter sp. EGI 63066]MCX2678918.1 heavy-metal-associated domain-containing protein [Galbibacter sp. EGI 63066]
MKKLAIIFLLLSFISMSKTNAQTPEVDKSEGLTDKIEVRVDGLSCPFCAYGLEKKLKDIDNVKEVEIDVKGAFAILTIQKGNVVFEKEIRQKVKEAGFTSKEITEQKEEQGDD